MTPFTGGYTIYLEREELMILFFPGSSFVGFSLSHVEHKESPAAGTRLFQNKCPAEVPLDIHYTKEAKDN